MGSARLGSMGIVRPSDFGTRGPSILILAIVFCPCTLVVSGSFGLSWLRVRGWSGAIGALAILPSLFLFIFALRGAHDFHRFGPSGPRSWWAAFDPGEPFRCNNFDNVRQVLPPRLRPIGNSDVAQPPSFVERILDAGSAHAG